MALQILCVGAGRDGTLTAASLISDILRLNNIDGQCIHELHSRDLYDLHCRYLETREDRFLSAIRCTIEGISTVAMAGNGYASLLPYFAVLHPGVRLIHLKRRDKAAFIASQVRNSQLFPETYVYYSASSGAMRRIAAFHTGELSREAWDGLSLDAKFAWFYDFTHASIEAAKPLFPAVLDLCTEDLSVADTLAALARFVAGPAAAVPSPRRLNGHAFIDIFDFAPDARPLAQWLFGRLPATEIERDPLFLAEYSLNSAVAWIGYLKTGSAAAHHPSYTASPEEVLRIATRFETMLAYYRGEMSRFVAELESPEGTDPPV